MYAGWPVAFGLFMLFGHHWELLCSTLKMLVLMRGGPTMRSKCTEVYWTMFKVLNFFVTLGSCMTLHELSVLSQELQAHSITLLRAQHLLKRTIRVIHSFKESPGEKYGEALEAKESGVYRSIALKRNTKLKSVNPGQFLQSLVNNLEQRLSFKDETIKNLSILAQSKWPSNSSIRHGEEQVKRLCKQFNLCTNQALNVMRDLLEEPNSEPNDIKPLINCMKTCPVSTAECERNFSLMNNISTDKRAVLLVSNISNLMMININGPPTSKFDPRKYTRTWLKSHRAASSVRSRQCSVKTPVKTPAESKSVWNIL
ncbi:zinc finger protein 862-like [Myxocyprinus asiaticus]|uniref:zinc finger protein 862-like n=1 Tax=Myxocyprinus asiaticus TaxID=70543 RepID=UPI0022224607|nr:zinc finger protein 862-like [Myxocyprinus asiaticus]XP_051575724.1 zinc finger protein 862-like [Myxocyprinus asiaticus]XP_051575725.1 zinc finger protein 862-like [Myxocyprinus asiaticus]